jgi:hypothetical protein
MRPQIVTVGPLALASAAILFGPASVVTGAVTLGSTALDKARRVIFTSSGNDTGLTYTVSGTNWAGDTISETVAGVSAAAATTVLDYLSLTSVSVNGASAGTLSIGTNGVAASPWVRLDNWAPAPVAVQLSVFGTVNATLQQTLDDPNPPVNVPPAAMVWVNSADAAAVNFSAAVQTNYAFAPLFVRVLLNSGSGSVTATVQQLGSISS